MTVLTVGWKPRIIIPEASAYASVTGRSSRGAVIIAPTARYPVSSPSLMPRYLEIYKRALANEGRLREEIQGTFSSVRIVGLEKELTRLLDDSMCLKRMRTLLHLDPITADAAPFIALEKHTEVLRQKIRCMGIFMRLHDLRDEQDPSAYQRGLLACLFKAKAHIPSLSCKKRPQVIDPDNKSVYESLFYVLKDRFIGLHMDGENLEKHVSFIKAENLPYMNIDVLLVKLSNLIAVVKDPRFETAVAEKISVSALISLRAAMAEK
ncbi:MAG: hypothetical protein NTX49_04785 [Chlamydiae bacterium]|nr:hypothetical protein [Chlamydiota bacterium]